MAEPTEAPPPPQPAVAPSLQTFMRQRSADTLVWLLRAGCMLLTIAFFLPLFGIDAAAAYQKALVCNVAISALRLHQRLPPFQLSRDYFNRMFTEDSCHYLVYSLCFLVCPGVSAALLPPFLFSALHFAAFTRQLLTTVFPGSYLTLIGYCDRMRGNSEAIFRFVALLEIILLPLSIVLIFVGSATLILPIFYYRFLTLRYTSQRNPYSRRIFSELRYNCEMWSRDARCPGFLGNGIRSGISLISRLAPPAAPTS